MFVYEKCSVVIVLGEKYYYSLQNVFYLHRAIVAEFFKDLSYYVKTLSVCNRVNKNEAFGFIVFGRYLRLVLKASRVINSQLVVGAIRCDIVH